MGLVFVGIGCIVEAVYRKYSTVIGGKVIESECTQSICTSTRQSKKHTTTIVKPCYHCVITVQDAKGTAATATLKRQRHPIQKGDHRKLMCTNSGECVAFVDAVLIRNIMVGLGVATSVIGGSVGAFVSLR